MSDELNKIPPQNLEAEASVLGSILIDAEAIAKIADILLADDFYKNAHTQIFEIMLELYSEREPIDLLSLTNRLEEKKLLDKVGGRSYLAELTNSVVTSSNILSYAQIVQKKAALRKLLQAAQEITALGYNEEDKVDSLLDEAEQKIFKISQKHLKQNFVSVKSLLDETFERIDEMHRDGGKIRGLPTTFLDLDSRLAGLQKSDLIILAARPSMGKTTLALDIARQIGKNKHPVGIFSLEMSKEQLVDRILCAEAGVDLWKMRTGKLSDREEDDDFPRIAHAMSVLSEAPIFIDDSATANIMELRTKARRLKAEHGLELIIIDYLQLMEGRSSRSAENRVQEVSEISRSLKALARELNIPVLALSQLSRAVEAERPPIPKLSHLRESGSIEQDADVVLFIYREYMYKRDDTDPDKRNIAEVFIAKHRNGPTGRVELIFNEDKVRFENKARGDTSQPEF